LPFSSILTKQNSLFLYLLLAAGLFGAGKFVYDTWLAAVIPHTKRTNSDVPRIVRPTSPVTTGKYDESWIPEHHIKKPATTRQRTGGAKNKKGGD
jgi:hypothetical protein